MEIVIAIIIGIIIWVVIRNKNKVDKATPSQNEVSYNYDIVGEQSYQKNLKKIAGPKEQLSKFYKCVAKVTSEPSNKYDKDAIKVEINGLLVGYLNRSEAQKLSGKNINKTVLAVINGGWNDGDSEGSYGVKLAINNISDLV